MRIALSLMWLVLLSYNFFLSYVSLYIPVYLLYSHHLLYSSFTSSTENTSRSLSWTTNCANMIRRSWRWPPSNGWPTNHLQTLASEVAVLPSPLQTVPEEEVLLGQELEHRRLSADLRQRPLVNASVEELPNLDQPLPQWSAIPTSCSVSPTATNGASMWNAICHPMQACQRIWGPAWTPAIRCSCRG